MENLSDRELVDQYKAGEPVFDAIYNRYYNLVLGSCLKYLKDRTDAKDAASDIFLSISKKLQTHNVKNLKSWLFTVTRNHCIEIFRSKKRHTDKILPAEVMYTSNVFHLDSEVAIEKVKVLKACIEKLPDMQKKTVVDFYYEKEGYKQIAAKYEITWDRVRSLMQNGRRNLKNCMEKNNIKK